MKNMIANGYADARTLAAPHRAIEAWLANPQLLEADKDAEYAAVIEIDLADIKEPIVCCPNDPDDAKFCPKWPAPRSTRPSSVRA
jgi:aconitate hydratase 2/2-methylisocitrate dehydratase